MSASKARAPTREELLDLLERLSLAAQSMVARWNDDIPAETREEILTNIYEPITEMLIRARRLPKPR